LIYLQTARDAV